MFIADNKSLEAECLEGRKYGCQYMDNFACLHWKGKMNFNTTLRPEPKVRSRGRGTVIDIRSWGGDDPSYARNGYIKVDNISIYSSVTGRKLYLVWLEMDVTGKMQVKKQGSFDVYGGLSHVENLNVCLPCSTFMDLMQ